MSDARSIKPGDPDHPAEQVKKASFSGVRNGPTYAMRLVLHPLNPDSKEPGPTISEIETIVESAIEQKLPGFTANADATRTDR